MIEPTVRKSFNTPFPVHVFQLKNGLNVLLSPNKLEPRIQTNIVVKAGSKHDPDDCTGLAHYFEHMMFKGSSKIGTIDWEKEYNLLKQIEELYEKHRNTTDKEERKTIYAQIDKLSNEAANYAVPNEYDKIISEIGGRDTNAYTWVEQTVYLNNIPSNQLDNWLKLEAERFRHCSLRLFHTELETVYEEFNITQDSDPRKVAKELTSILFPTHPYGTHTTIGEGEDLKAPSQTAIHKFFKQYYVPNNMAICLSGDFETEEALSLVEKYFGEFEASEVPPFQFEEQEELNELKTTTVYGQKAEYIEIAWRLPGASTQTLPYYDFIQNILQNAQVGLLDWIKREQKVLDANAYIYTFKDYSALRISAMPRQGQSLDEVKDIIINVVDELRKGSFEDWIIPGIVKDIKLSLLNGADSNTTRANAMAQAEVWGVAWDSFAERIQILERISKDDILNFMETHMSKGAALVYKKQGDDPNVLKMEKPDITPLPMNKEAQSEFAKSITQHQPDPIKSQFLNFKDHFEIDKLENGRNFHYQKNTFNESFRATINWRIGKLNNPYIGLVSALVNYIFTEQYSLKEFQNTLFKNGLFIQSKSSGRSTLITIQGLGESFDKGMELLHEILSNATISEEALKNIKIDLFKSRMNALSNKQVILRDGLLNYVKYGKENPFTDRLSAEKIINFSVKDAEELIRSLLNYPATVYYYGDADMESSKHTLNHYFGKQTINKEIPDFKEYRLKDNESQDIYLLDFPMVQTDLLFHTKCRDEFVLEDMIMADWYNQYFGYGLSSIMFQEIREAKAYGYSTYAYYSSPARKDKEHSLTAYLGTQPDKINTAIPEILQLLNEMPVVPNQMEQTRQSILKNLESSRISRQNIYWTWMKNKRLGTEEDLREKFYNTLSTVTNADLVRFHEEVIKDRTYNIILMGPKDSLDTDHIKTLGKYTELTVEEVFGFSMEDLQRALTQL